MLKIGAQQSASGFGFLQSTAGFDISETIIAYDPEMSYGRAILAGFTNTLLASFISAVLATMIGLVMGGARLSRNFMLRNVALGISESIRNVPLLLQLLVWYGLILNTAPSLRQAHSLAGIFLTNRGVYFPSLANIDGSIAFWVLPLGLLVIVGLMWWPKSLHLLAGRTARTIFRMGLVCVAVGLTTLWVRSVRVSWPLKESFNITGGVSVSPELTAMILGLAVYAGAFIGELIRSGVLSVPRGQVEAAYAIGLGPMRRFRLVVYPQALRLVLPPASSVYLGIAKNTSLGVAIGFPDVSSVIATIINQSGQAVEGMLIQILAYLTLSFIVWIAVNTYDRRTRYVLR
jgi:general L-amino acid transport system permease protein